MAEVVADKVVEEVVGSLFAKVKKEICYMCNCKENVKKLRSEVDKLENMKKTVELQIESVKDNADALVPGVEKWVEDALAPISEAKKFLKEEADAKKTCFNLSMCVNPNTLRHYGKHAAKRIPDLEQQQKNGEAFKDKISIHISKPSNLALSPRENFEGLDTHASVIEKIIDSVNDKSTQITQITGVWGMGGVGKTTIITEVAARVKDLFADVVLVTVTEKVGKKKVQARIQKEVANAAKRVTHDGEKVLIILDDVWTKFMLHEVGIPCGTRYPSCKILLTSRQKSVCTVMKADTIIAVQPLPIEEALALFKRVVGENCDNLKGVKVVRKDILNACGGLPLLIQAAGY